MSSTLLSKVDLGRINLTNNCSKNSEIKIEPVGCFCKDQSSFHCRDPFGETSDDTCGSGTNRATNNPNNKFCCLMGDEKDGRSENVACVDDINNPGFRCNNANSS